MEAVVRITDWEGIKGEYRIFRMGEVTDNGMVGIAFENSVGDIEKVMVHISTVSQRKFRIVCSRCGKFIGESEEEPGTPICGVCWYKR